jgi:Amidohydrolase family
VRPELYSSLHALAERLDVLVVTHLAETQEEDRDIRRRYGRSPIRHLANLGLVDSRLVAAHCVWIDGEEIDLLAAARAGVVHNPRSNLKLASGVARIPDMLRAGVLVGLGTDGAASNNALNLLAEIQTAALIHKGVRLDPLAVPAATALEMATIGGARALKLDHLVGSLEPGKRAGIVIIDWTRTTWCRSTIRCPTSRTRWRLPTCVPWLSTGASRSGTEYSLPPTSGRFDARCARSRWISAPSGEARGPEMRGQREQDAPPALRFSKLGPFSQSLSVRVASPFNQPSSKHLPICPIPAGRENGYCSIQAALTVPLN